MAKKERISINAFEKVMKENYTNEKTIEWHGINVTITKTLSFKEAISFVNSVVNSCFSEENAFIPESKDFAFKVNVLERYANFTMPTDVSLQYDLIYKTDAFDTVLCHIDSAQLFEIKDAIEAKLENRLKANIEAFNKQTRELYNAFNNIQNRFNEVFKGLSGNDLRIVANAISEGTLDESKLVDAYIKAKRNDAE